MPCISNEGVIISHNDHRRQVPSAAIVQAHRNIWRVDQGVDGGQDAPLRGQVGTDFDGNLVGPGDPGVQAEQAMQNVKQLLEESGSDLSHIVKTTTYITDPGYREPVYQVVGKWLKGVFPISTGIVVAGLGQPEWLMEIDVIAVIPED